MTTTAPAHPRKSTGTVAPTFRRDVQGIRALAVTMVVLFHAGGIVPGGFVGVDIFFVVSGFVITGLLDRELVTAGGISLKRFYLRRARRLLPAAALMSIFVVLASALFSSPFVVQHDVGSAAVAAALFSSNAYFTLTTGGYFQSAAEDNPFLHTWSLAVEEQFYLVFPIMLLLVFRLSLRMHRRVAVPMFTLMALVSFTFSLITTHGWIPNLGHLVIKVQNHHEVLAFYTPMSRAWEFLAGAIVYTSAPRINFNRAVRRVMGMTGLAIVVGSMLLIRADGLFPGEIALWPVLGTAALLLHSTSGSEQDQPVARLLSGRAMTWMGDRSYSWYLWHWPFIVFARTWFPANQLILLGSATVSLLVACLTFQFFERPIHHGRTITGKGSAYVLIAAFFGFPIMMGLALQQAAAHSWGRSDIAEVQAEIAPLHADELHGCARATSLALEEPSSCIWGKSGRPGVLLIGDSNAGHFTEPLVRATGQLGYRLEVITMDGCPMIVRQVYSSENCRHFVNANLRFLQDNPRRYVAIVISNASTTYVANQAALDAKGDDPSSRRWRFAVASQRWAKDMQATVRMLPPVSGVAVIGAVPQFPDLPRCLMPSILVSVGPSCGRLKEAGPAFHLRSEQISAEASGVMTAGGTYMDTGRRLCVGRAGCSAFGAEGEFLYRDGAHLSVSGSMVFAGDLEKTLRSVARR